MFFGKLNLKSSFLPILLAGIFFALFFFVFVLGTDFPINDDWLFVRQVEAFGKGIYEINQQIEPSFILQGILGFLWTMLFGMSFESLHVLTYVFFLASVLVLFKFLKVITSDRVLIYFVLFSYIFNPLILASSYTFMTEIYSIFFLMVSGYFYYLNLDKDSEKHFLLGTLFSGLGFLVRQTLITVYLAALVVFLLKKRHSGVKAAIKSVLIYLPFLLIWGLWPRYGSNPLILSLGDIKQRLESLPYFFIYFGYFLVPFYSNIPLNTFKNHTKISRHTIAVSVVSILFLVLSVFYIYPADVFPLGNMLYVESLYGKSDFRSNLSIFDNVPYKLFLSFVISLSILRILKTSFRAYQTGKVNTRYPETFLMLLFVFNILILFITKDIYDRYFVNAFVVLILVFVLFTSKEIRKLNILNISLVFLFAYHSLAINYEFVITEKLKWEQARKIISSKDIYLGIQLNDTYTKYMAAERSADYRGYESAIPGGLVYSCYVQDYTIDGTGNSSVLVTTIEEKIERVLKNPRITGSRKNEEIKRIKKHLQELEYNQMYFSPLYSIIGKTAYVGSWCD